MTLGVRDNYQRLSPVCRLDEILRGVTTEKYTEFTKEMKISKKEVNYSTRTALGASTGFSYLTAEQTSTEDGEISVLEGVQTKLTLVQQATSLAKPILTQQERLGPILKFLVNPSK